MAPEFMLGQSVIVNQFPEEALRRTCITVLLKQHIQ